MKLRTGVSSTGLEEVEEAVTEKKNRTEITKLENALEDSQNQINQSLILHLRNSLGYLGEEPEWVELRTTLNRYMIRVENAYFYFPVVVNCLRMLAGNGCKKPLVCFLELADQLSMDKDNLEIFVSKLLTLNASNPMKNPLAVLRSLQNIEPDNWQEVLWYMDLIIDVDLTMAEVASMYVEQFRNKPAIYIFFLLQIARTGRLEAMDRYVELLPVLEKYGDNIFNEMKPVMDLISEEKLAEAEMMLVALGQIYGKESGDAVWKKSVS